MLGALSTTPRGERDSMTIVLALAALACGGLTLFLLWPYGLVVALLATPFVTSAVVLIAALVIAATRSRAEVDSGRGVNVIIDALNKLLPR